MPGFDGDGFANYFFPNDRASLSIDRHDDKCILAIHGQVVVLAWPSAHFLGQFFTDGDRGGQENARGICAFG